MKKLVVLIIILVLVTVFTVLCVKVVKAVQSDRYHFSQMKLSSKVKYTIKTAYYMIRINLSFHKRQKHPKEDLLKDKEILLLGASIGRSWYIYEYFDFIKSLAVYRFDKTKELQEYITDRESHKKPDAIILKECAAFIHADSEKFDKEFMNYQNIYRDMVQTVKRNNIIPITATVCPLAYKGEHLENILKFNDWVKQYAENNNLAMLDIEGAVRISQNNRMLRKEISQTDGLHLTREAYESYLNPIMIPVLLKAFD
ncbi:MAG: hypothetical protein JXI43_00040 [Tissierellales bacterium]|nr:hypothetical protein [Tissierellales bacterium]